MPIGRVLVENQTAHFVQRVVSVGPDFSQVEGVESVVFGLFERHELNLESPAREVSVFNGVEEIAAMVVGVLASHLVGLFLGEKIDALICLEVVFHPESFPLGVDPHVGVAGVAVHVPPGLRYAPVAQEPGHLMGALGRQSPEIPLHIVVAQAVVGAAFLGVDEMLELQRVTHEEDGCVVSHHVVVAFGSVKLQGEAARITPGVGTSALAGDRGEAYQSVGLGLRLKDGCLGVGADVLGHLEVSESSRAFGVRLAVRDHLPVEVRHLLEQVVVVQNDGAVGAYGEGVLVAGYRDSGVCGGVIVVLIAHGRFPVFKRLLRA